MISGAMSQIWGMVNGLQLFVHIPLFNIIFPETAGVVVEKLTMVATFELLPTDDIYEESFDLPEEHEVEYLDEPTKERLDAGDYGSGFFIANMGTLFFVFVMMLTVPICVFMSRPCRSKSRWCFKKHNSTLAAIRGNLWIRYLMEACLDVSISGTINIIVLLETGKIDTSNTFEVINAVALFVIYAATLAFPIGVLAFYARRYQNWGDKDFDSKYGAIFVGLRKDKRTSLLYPFVFSLRRILLTIVIVVASSYLYLQLLSQLVVMTFQIWYLVTFKPFEEPLLQKLEIYNELTMIILVYCVMTFSPLNSDIESNELSLVIVFLGCLCGNILVHLYFLCKDSLLSGSKKCKKACCMKPSKQKESHVNKIVLLGAAQSKSESGAGVSLGGEPAGQQVLSEIVEMSKEERDSEESDSDSEEGSESISEEKEQPEEAEKPPVEENIPVKKPLLREQSQPSRLESVTFPEIR